MNKPIISVVVPIYNVEKYLAECIQSVLDQTFQNFELILVNDGSPDKCGEICEKYAKIDDRIVYISQKNKGVSAARNKGLELARGEYVYVMDSDDTLNKKYLENAYTLAQKNRVDLVVNWPDANVAAVEGWRCFIRRSVLIQYPDLRFPEGIQPCEDGLFTHKLLALVPAVFYPDLLYNYRLHPGQDHVVNNNRTDEVLSQIPTWFDILRTFYDKHQLWDKKRLHLARFMEIEPWRNRFILMSFSLEQKEKLYHLIKNFMNKYVLPGLAQEEYLTLNPYFRKFLEAKDFKKALKTSKPKNYRFLLFLIRFIPVAKWRRALRKRIKRK